jgi:RNA polymerase sigma factor (sigma-70 family)
MANVPKLAPLEPSPKRSPTPADAGRTGAAAQAKGSYDRDLVRRAQANDKEAYEELIKRHQLLYESDLSEEQAQRVADSESDGTGPDIRQRLENQQRVERLLEGLEERDKLMLILKEVEGFSIEEIAEVLDLNANTVKVRLFRARGRVVRQAAEREKSAKSGTSTKK